MLGKIEGTLSLQIPAGKANPAPPVGPALGQRGLNIQDFCTQFNNHCKEKGYDVGDIIPVVITIYKGGKGKTFTFVTKSPPVPELIKKELKLKKGSSNPGKEVAGEISRDQIVKIAEIKKEDMGVLDIESAINMVSGTAVSMGIKVKES